MDADELDFTFSGEIRQWRGPAPYYFVAVPSDASAIIRGVSSAVTYGWGVIPVEARIGDTMWRTSLFPKDGSYLVPIKTAVRTAERITEGDRVTVQMTVPFR